MITWRPAGRPVGRTRWTPVGYPLETRGDPRGISGGHLLDAWDRGQVA